MDVIKVNLESILEILDQPLLFTIRIRELIFNARTLSTNVYKTGKYRIQYNDLANTFISQAEQTKVF